MGGLRDLWAGAGKEVGRFIGEIFSSESSTPKTPWSEPFTFNPEVDDAQEIKGWDCAGKAGIYMIRDAQDEHTLYVGMSKNDIASRLHKHMTCKGNGNIGERIAEDEESFTVRWVECDDPATVESVALTYLLPSDNEKSEYKGFETIPIDQELAIATWLNVPEFWHTDYETRIKQIISSDHPLKGFGTKKIMLAEAVARRCKKYTSDPNGGGGEEGGEKSFFQELFNPSDSQQELSDSTESSESFFGSIFNWGSSDEPEKNEQVVDVDYTPKYSNSQNRYSGDNEYEVQDSPEPNDDCNYYEVQDSPEPSDDRNYYEVRDSPEPSNDDYNYPSDDYDYPSPSNDSDYPTDNDQDGGDSPSDSDSDSKSSSWW